MVPRIYIVAMSQNHGGVDGLNEVISTVEDCRAAAFDTLTFDSDVSQVVRSGGICGRCKIPKTIVEVVST